MWLKSSFKSKSTTKLYEFAEELAPQEMHNPNSHQGRTNTHVSSSPNQHTATVKLSDSNHLNDEMIFPS